MLAYSMSSDDESGFGDPNCHNPTARGVTIPSPDSPLHTGLYSRGNSTGAISHPSNDYDLQRSRSASLSLRIRDTGGANSINSFARSWQRAAAFPEVLPRRSSFVTLGSDDDPTTSIYEASSQRASQSHDQVSQHATPKLGLHTGFGDDHGLHGRGMLRTRISLSNVIGSSMDQSLAGSYGTISSRVSQSARRNATQFYRDQQSLADAAVHGEAEPLLLKQVQHEDGSLESIIIGQSTVPQTIFNSVNVLIGVGLLSLPLAMKQAGWLLGLLFLSFAAISTSYTAKILAKCLNVDRSLVTYADLAYISFGHRARLVTSLLFCLELLGACVALVVLFADSLHLLVPEMSILHWKVVCGIMLTPLSFVPLRLLSVTSILGIISCTSIVLIVCLDGFIKTESPGSLIQPSRTSLFPGSWSTVPLSFGLIMSPWGGHGVFPNIYTDMRHPQNYGKSLWATYLFTYFLDCAMAIVGWVMFGDAVGAEITANVLQIEVYPQALSICMIVFIAIIPITKVPLNSRPLVATVEVLCGLGSCSMPSQSRYKSSKEAFRQPLQAVIRVLVIAIIVLVAIIFPDFDRIMALMGSALCFTICIILPLAFYLKIFGKEISPKERILNWGLLLVSSTLAIVGTLWAFLPQELITHK